MDVIIFNVVQSANRTTHFRVSMTSPAQKILHDVFGYATFRGEQQAIVEQIASGGDALVLMPTGVGFYYV